MNIYNLISDLDKKISAEVEIDDKNNIQVAMRLLEFRNVQTNSSIKDLMTELKKIKKTNFKEDDGDIDEEEYFKARA